MSQGDLSVDAFTQQMKQTADALREVGHTISPAQLVLNLLRGINPRFATTTDIIANTIPLPDFKSANNMLCVKELRLGTERKEASASALTASTTPSCTSSSCRSTPPPTSSRGGGGKGKGAKSKGGRGGNGSSSTGGGRHQQSAPPGVFGGRQGPQPAGPWVCYNPWAAPWPNQQQSWAPSQQQSWAPSQQQSWASPPPTPQAHAAFAPAQFSAAAAPSPYGPSGGWDQANLIAALNQMAIQGQSPWVMDSGATSHMSSNDGILLSRLPSPPSSIMVGNGHSIPVSSRGTSSLHLADRTFHLHNVHVAPQLARNLLSVRQFTRDNNCSIEFDASGFSVKDLRTQTVLLRAIATGTSTPFRITCLFAAMSLSSPRSCGTPALVIQHVEL
jgi:hypothetical protein